MNDTYGGVIRLLEGAVDDGCDNEGILNGILRRLRAAGEQSADGSCISRAVMSVSERLERNGRGFRCSVFSPSPCTNDMRPPRGPRHVRNVLCPSGAYGCEVTVEDLLEFVGMVAGIVSTHAGADGHRFDRRDLNLLSLVFGRTLWSGRDAALSRAWSAWNGGGIGRLRRSSVICSPDDAVSIVTGGDLWMLDMVDMAPRHRDLSGYDRRDLLSHAADGFVTPSVWVSAMDGITPGHVAEGMDTVIDHIGDSMPDLSISILRPFPALLGDPETFAPVTGTGDVLHMMLHTCCMSPGHAPDPRLVGFVAGSAGWDSVIPGDPLAPFIDKAFRSWGEEAIPHLMICLGWYLGHPGNADMMASFLMGAAEPQPDGGTYRSVLCAKGMTDPVSLLDDHPRLAAHPKGRSEGYSVQREMTAAIVSMNGMDTARAGRYADAILSYAVAAPVGLMVRAAGMGDALFRGTMDIVHDLGLILVDDDSDKGPCGSILGLADALVQGCMRVDRGRWETMCADLAADGSMPMRNALTNSVIQRLRDDNHPSAAHTFIFATSKGVPNLQTLPVMEPTVGYGWNPDQQDLLFILSAAPVAARMFDEGDMHPGLGVDGLVTVLDPDAIIGYGEGLCDGLPESMLVEDALAVMGSHVDATCGDGGHNHPHAC